MIPTMGSSKRRISGRSCIGRSTCFRSDNFMMASARLALIRFSEAMRQHLDDALGDLALLGQNLHEVLALNLERGQLLGRRNGGRAGLRVEDRHFAEALALAEL